ncbi:MAG: glutaminase A, partial [Cyanobium sp.]
MAEDTSLHRPAEGAAAIQELLEELHQRHRDDRGGAVADYIPELARADPDGFGIALATPDGRVYTVGDTAVPFTIQSISKPFVYGLALDRLFGEQMARKVGVEPSGEAFNAISLDPVSGIPRNPMINAGAIATTAQIRRQAGERAEDQLLAVFSGLAGNPLSVDQAVYASERDTGHRNRAISHLLRNAGVIEEDPELGLDLYFRQCAITVTCRDLAVMAATLACQGRQPLSGERLLSRDSAIRMLALMGTCGMYDYAGHWLHDVGMPAKSGVAGGVLAVVPGRLGLAVWSPRLDRYGNSVRGIAVCEELSGRLGLHLYDQNPASHD